MAGELRHEVNRCAICVTSQKWRAMTNEHDLLTKLRSEIQTDTDEL